MPEIKLVNVSKKYGKIVALKDINLEIEDKEYITILGPSGCGKTTLLKIIAGLVNPDTGEVYINGKLVNDIPPEERNVGFVFQNYALFPHLNVWQNVTYGPVVKGYEPSQIEKIGLESLRMTMLDQRREAFPNELSGGMQQRVGVARALASGSNILLLDEPFGALDAKIRAQLRYEIRKLAKDLKLTVIHITHDQEEAMVVSDRIVIMRSGKIEQVGTPKEIYIRPKTIFTANFIGEANFMEGCIDKVKKNFSLVDIGEKIKVFSTEFEENEPVVIAIRPENILLKPRWINGCNALHGVVDDVIFLGEKTRYEIKVGDKRLVVKASETKKLKKGEKVTTFLNPKSILIYKYPSAGLRGELKLE